MSGISFSEAILQPDFPLAGCHLIEASAGTGKTYALQTVYLRLVVAEGIPITRILAVTFTEAATYDLRRRMREILDECRRYFSGCKTAEDRVTTICALPPSGADCEREREIRYQRIEAALRDFDEAAIYTIHGFCHRLLINHAFECGQAFSLDLSGADDKIFAEACADWWRQHAYDSPLIAGIQKYAEAQAAARLLLAKPDSRRAPEADFQTSKQNLENQLEELLAHCDGEAIEKALGKQRILGKWGNPSVRVRDICALARLRQSRCLTADAIAAISRIGKALEASIDADLQRICAIYAKASQAIAAVRASMAADMASLCAQRKRKQRQITYDDLIREVQMALRDSQRRHRLRAALRRAYDAVFVDEFQDTDPAQYEIFRGVFLSSAEDDALPLHRVFLVGDPKQAIYAFRHGDIYAYFAAAADSLLHRHALTVNYRSEVKLVDAVNLIFRDAFDVSGADPDTNIDYPSDLQAKGKENGDALFEKRDADQGEMRDPHPFHVWYYDLPTDRFGIGSPGYESIYNDVADEVARLLNNPDIKIGERQLRPRDIAILVTKHREADAIYRCLRARHVPAVRQHSGNLFAGDEADDLQFLLAALLEPAHAAALAAVFATDLFPLCDRDLEALLNGERLEWQNARYDLSQCIRCFQSARYAWEKHSLFAAFQYLDQTYGILPHMLAQENGERRVTNLLQLLEMLDRAAAEYHLAPIGIAAWLAQQRAQASTAKSEIESDAGEMRLESDEEAVQLLTIHKSKGLQFPIVFIPTLAASKTASPGFPYVYHQKQRSSPPKWEVIVDFTGDGRQYAQQEAEQERIRLFYVAATRAINRVYLVWGNFGRCDDFSESIVTRVLRKLELCKAAGGEADWSAIKSAISAAGEAGPIKFELRTLANAETKPAGKLERKISSVDPAALQTWQEHAGVKLTVNTSCRHTSYSDLAPSQVSPAAYEDRDYDVGEEASESSDDDIFSFPSGERTGICWHEILRRLDYAALAAQTASPMRAQAEALIADLHKEYGLLPRHAGGRAKCRLKAAVNMFRNVLTTPLLNDSGLTLCQIPAAQQRREFGFDFALRRWSAKERAVNRRKLFLGEILARHWRGEEHRLFLSSAEGWELDLPQGFLCGYIDLIFRQGERYYLLDWKSHRCGGVMENFSCERLRQLMAAEGYWLQYLIYTVALHHHLRCRLPDYDYDRHFGGVFYIFLRGVDPRFPGQGIYFDKPPLSLVAELSQALGDFQA